MKKKILGIFAVLVGLMGVRNINAVSLPDMDLDYGSSYVFEAENSRMVIDILDTNTMALYAKNSSGIYENTRGTYTVSGNRLTYSRTEAYDGAENYVDCLSGDGICHFQDKNLSLTEEFYISSDGKSLSSTTYGMHLNLTGGEVTLSYAGNFKKVEEFTNILWQKFRDLGLNAEFIRSGIFGEIDDIMIKIFKDDELLGTTTFKYKDGILTYCKPNNSALANPNILFDNIVIFFSLEAIGDIYEYDRINFGNWFDSLTEEQSNNLTIGKDGISVKYMEEHYEDDTSSSHIRYISEFNVDLYNGIKAYKSNITYDSSNNGGIGIFGEAKKNLDLIINSNNQINNTDKEEDENLPENPKTGSFLSISLLGFATVLSTTIFYVTKRKNKIYKI